MQEGRVGMTPSRGGLDALSTKSPPPYKLEGRWCLVFLSLLWGTRGFVLVPGNGAVRAGLFYEQRATVRFSTATAWCMYITVAASMILSDPQDTRGDP